MRLALCLTTALLLFGLGAFAADHPVIGTWQWTATPDEGDQVSGELEVKAAGGGKIDAVMVLHDGARVSTENPKTEGDDFSFDVTVEGNLYHVTVTVSGDKFKGKFTGDAAKGTIEGSKKA